MPSADEMYQLCQNVSYIKVFKSSISSKGMALKKLLFVQPDPMGGGIHPLLLLPKSNHLQPDVDNSPLRLGNFLVNARAQQTKERNRRTGEMVQISMDEWRGTRKQVMLLFFVHFHSDTLVLILEMFPADAAGKSLKRQQR